MNLLPAIDLMGGHVVRLRRGLAAEKTVYSDDPVGFARKWEASGADWLHIVDLDAAFGGSPRNLEVIARVCAAVSVPCELGGGMRDEERIGAAFAAGVSRVVLGTRACEDPGFAGAMCRRFGGGRVAVGIDAKDGLVAVRGWTDVTPRAALDLALEVRAAGVATIIHTDIATDGMLEGPNFGALEEFASRLGGGVIASGGVTTADDVRRLAKIPGLDGVIIGKALYDGHIEGNLRDILRQQAD